jgi:DNA-binding CsgD family transcriptional regulator
MSLSPRETEILRYVAAGHTTKETAMALHVAESTVEWHMANVLEKLRAASRAEAVAIGMRDGLLVPSDQGDVGGPARHGIKRTRRAAASEEARVIAFDLLGLHLGDVRIGTRRRGAAQTEGETATDDERSSENRD